MTKKEIKQYDQDYGWKEGYVMCPSFFEAIVILDFDGEQVAGYYQYMENQKEYFCVKARMVNHKDYPGDFDYSFRIRNRTYRISAFLRTHL